MSDKSAQRKTITKKEPVQLVPLLVDVHAAAALLSMSRTFFLEQIALSRINIKAIPVGKKRLYSVESLQEWVRTEVVKMKSEVSA